MGAATDSTHVQVTEAWQYSNEVKAIIGNTVFFMYRCYSITNVSVRLPIRLKHKN